MGILDPAALENLREMVGGDTEFVSDLIDTFLDQAPQMLADMRQGLASGDVVVVRRSAHSLKSNSAEFGAQALFTLCQEIETMCKSGVPVGAELVARVEDEFAKVKTALRAVQQQL
jgi:HPt (histidine-containing phosphotransfer) domain-containing protein